MIVSFSVVGGGDGGDGLVRQRVKINFCSLFFTQEEMDKYPDVWFRYKVQNMWNKSLETVARFVRADPQDLVFVANATAGINSVLKFLDLYS